MEVNLSETYLPILKSLSAAELDAEIARPERLVVSRGVHGARKFETVYAPFDHFNVDARIVIVGITPGRSQMTAALRSAHRSLREGRTEAEALRIVKSEASFAGPMRSYLVSLLDSIGAAELLGVASTSELWVPGASKAQFTSVLRYPVRDGGADFAGAGMLTVPYLKEQLDGRWLADMARMRDMLFVPLGPKVAEVLLHYAPLAGLERERVLDGLPHPSGSNAERISYFLGRKPRHLLSGKTNADKLDTDRERLLANIARLRDRAA